MGIYASDADFFFKLESSLLLEPTEMRLTLVVLINITVSFRLEDGSSVAQSCASMRLGCFLPAD